MVYLFDVTQNTKKSDINCAERLKNQGKKVSRYIFE
jgi:hypothetical protein